MIRNPIIKQVTQFFPGRESAVEMACATVLAGGHLLIEGMPGLGKTRLAEKIAKAFGLPFSRIQMTADLLQSDITGSMIYNPAKTDFVFFPGPIFADLVLIDEINRAPPRTQSALIECMANRRVTVATKTHDLPRHFMVIATANPSIDDGAYGLPLAILDRFMARVALERPGPKEEAGILLRYGMDEVNEVEEAPKHWDWRQARESIHAVHLSDDLARAVVKEADKRREKGIAISVRAGIHAVMLAKSMAWLKDRDFVTPEDIHQVIPHVFDHRSAS
jgi:MoxR-like ATPase